MKIEFVFTELIDFYGFGTIATFIVALGTVLPDGTVVRILRLVSAWSTFR